LLPLLPLLPLLLLARNLPCPNLYSRPDWTGPSSHPPPDLHRAFASASSPAPRGSIAPQSLSLLLRRRQHLGDAAPLRKLSCARPCDNSATTPNESPATTHLTLTLDLCWYVAPCCIAPNPLD
ncbi:hypothetical protein IWX92DRAFT_437826, partial [Phyllosticta citricarpa]